MSRWLIKADIAQTEVTEISNINEVDRSHKDQSEEQQVSMKYDPKDTYQGNVDIAMTEAEMRNTDE